MVLIFYFSANYLLHFYIAENRLIFAFSTLSLIDYISILPTLFVFLKVINTDDDIDKQELVELSAVSRYFSIYRFESILSRNNMERNLFYFLKLHY